MKVLREIHTLERNLLNSFCLWSFVHTAYHHTVYIPYIRHLLRLSMSYQIMITFYSFLFEYLLFACDKHSIKLPHRYQSKHVKMLNVD